jgi:hypothetical protein
VIPNVTTWPCEVLLEPSSEMLTGETEALV